MGSARNGKRVPFFCLYFCLECFNKAVAGSKYDVGVVIPVPFENEGFTCLGSRKTRGEKRKKGDFDARDNAHGLQFVPAFAGVISMACMLYLPCIGLGTIQITHTF